MSVKLTIHSVGRDECVLSAKEAEGMVVTFDDGTVKENSFLSTKSLIQLLRMRLGGSNGKTAGNASVTDVVSAEPVVESADEVDIES